MNKTVDTIIKFGIIVVLIIAAATRQQYSYYIFVRWVVFGTSIYYAYTNYDNKQTGLVIYFSCVAILFNPFKSFGIQKATWHLIDYLVAIITVVLLIYNWMAIYNKGNNDN